MMNRQPKQKLEGEGSYSATRRYNAGLAKHIRDGKVEELAKSAAQALAGEEATQLRNAGQQGKRGPRASDPVRRRRGAPGRQV
jgi:hypothetical protein